MKKIAALISFITIMVFGAYAHTIDELDGFDWVLFGEETKGAMVEGFYLSCNMVIVMSCETAAPNMTQEQFADFYKRLTDRFLYTGTVGQMVTLLDDYYSSPSNRQYRLLKTIPYLAGKEWWNRKTGKVELPAPPVNGG